MGLAIRRDLRPTQIYVNCEHLKCPVVQDTSIIPWASGGMEITLMIDPLGMVTVRRAAPPSIASVARSSLNRFPVNTLPLPSCSKKSVPVYDG